MNELTDKLAETKILTREEFKTLLICDSEYLHQKARAARQAVFGNKIYMRGLIEFTNYCKNDCYYCGLRRSNKDARRYRFTKNQILECCAIGYDLGFRTFVLQGGEDSFYTDEKLAEIIRSIKEKYLDCAVTLSLGERSYESLKFLREAGADRYLLRQETSDCEHYSLLHPPEMTLLARQKCLWDMKELGYQVGCGFMVGSPGQTTDHIVDDLFFINELDPAMVGVGPFIPHSSTPFAGEKPGDMKLTLNTIAILRLMNPNLLLPATTALGTVEPTGREMGVMAGANVVMPNLSPPHIREKYLLYDNKICTGDGPQQCRGCIGRRMNKIGCEIVVSRGDYVAV
ncbi:MAG: [FeFe] hydrogenase H-cluster radical SAM maturase HydE [Defluviitaleaceae bacterium]|nr:[FeFe] hydrogenase H-cluster radical SAM maturase HydE [Defluviitaleaceae bacterium]